MEKLEQQNKYYTPSIEEFCVGFEYRICDIETAHYSICVFQDGQSAQNLLDGDYGEVDVKHLSAEDIVELGFIQTKQYSNEVVFQKHVSDYEFIELTLHADEDYNITIEKWHQSKMVAKELPVDNNTWGNYIIFRGFVKNKSKLKEVLQMIGVL